MVAGRWSLGSVGGGNSYGLGYKVFKQGPWQMDVGVGTSISKSRSEADSDTLNGLGDIGRTTLGVVSAGYDSQWFSASTNVTSDIGGNNQGTQVQLNLQAKYSPLPGLVLSAGPGLKWADSKNAQTNYGVTAAQSISSGKAVYTASSGITSVNFGIGARYDISKQWGLEAKLSRDSLQGDAANSPIAQSKSQTSYGLSLNYRF